MILKIKKIIRKLHNLNRKS